jgi:hypothetical protein
MNFGMKSNKNTKTRKYENTKEPLSSEVSFRAFVIAIVGALLTRGPTTYGYKRWICRGKAIASRM